MIFKKNMFFFMLLIEIIFCLSHSNLVYGYGGKNGIDYKPRIWERIPEGHLNINDDIQNFLLDNGITNCFKHKENPTLLRLRCLCYSCKQKTFEVDISVFNNGKKKNINQNINADTKQFITTPSIGISV